MRPRLPIRACGYAHIGMCWTECFNRWSRPGAWIPPEYRHGGWYATGPEGRRPLRCP